MPVLQNSQITESDIAKPAYDELLHKSVDEIMAEYDHDLVDADCNDELLADHESAMSSTGAQLNKRTQSNVSKSTAENAGARTILGYLSALLVGLISGYVICHFTYPEQQQVAKACGENEPSGSSDATSFMEEAEDLEKLKKQIKNLEFKNKGKSACINQLIVTLENLRTSQSDSATRELLEKAKILASEAAAPKPPKAGSTGMEFANLEALQKIIKDLTSEYQAKSTMIDRLRELEKTILTRASEAAAAKSPKVAGAEVAPSTFAPPSRAKGPATGQQNRTLISRLGDNLITNGLFDERNSLFNERNEQTKRIADLEKQVETLKLEHNSKIHDFKLLMFSLAQVILNKVGQSSDIPAIESNDEFWAFVSIDMRKHVRQFLLDAEEYGTIKKKTSVLSLPLNQF